MTSESDQLVVGQEIHAGQQASGQAGFAVGVGGTAVGVGVGSGGVAVGDGKASGDASGIGMKTTGVSVFETAFQTSPFPIRSILL